MIFELVEGLPPHVSVHSEKDCTAAERQLCNSSLGTATSDYFQDIDYEPVDHDDDFVLTEIRSSLDDIGPMNNSSYESYYIGNDGADAWFCGEPMFTPLSPDTIYSERQDGVMYPVRSTSSTPPPSCAKPPLRPSSTSAPRALPIPRALLRMKCPKCPDLFSQKWKLE
jgi:hypothetical protein